MSKPLWNGLTTMGSDLVEERNSWRKQMEEGNFDPHPLYKEYLANRDSNLWRASCQIEKMFEYIRYLEELSQK